MELNVSAGCSTLLGALFSVGITTGEPKPKGLQGRHLGATRAPKRLQGRHLDAARARAKTATARALLSACSGHCEDERHYDAVLNKYMHTHTHTHMDTWINTQMHNYVHTYVHAYLGFAFAFALLCFAFALLCFVFVTFALLCLALLCTQRQQAVQHCSRLLQVLQAVQHC